MNYKVGDKVRVREDLEVGKVYEGYGFLNDMAEFKGKEVFINCVGSRSYNLKGSDWSWTDEMLEPIGFKDLPASKQGIDTSRYFTVVKECDAYNKGDLLKLREDDRSRFPFFTRIKDNKKYPKYWSNLRYATQEEIDAVLGEQKADEAFDKKVEEIGEGLDRVIKDFNRLTYSQFLKYLKKHGPTKARITEDSINIKGQIIPKGSIIEFLIDAESVSSYSENNISKNRADLLWEVKYKGLFEIIAEDKPNNLTDMPPEGYTNTISSDIHYYELQPRIKFNKSLKEKTMSIINNAFKSKENKSLEKFGLGTTDQLNERGRDEFVDYLFQNLPDQKKGFLEKIVEASKEEK